jgi:hypothetical protein
MPKEKKRQICFRIEESIVNKMEEIRDKTGVPISTQIELRLKGFTISSIEKEAQPKDIMQWYQSLKKDEEYANNIDKATNRMRELKLH